jgi:hypothetical protein
MPLLDTQGSDSADAYGGGAAAVPNYIEQVFSTYLYKGNGNGSGSTGTVATITNGLDLTTNGGLVWIKNRGRAVDHGLYDTARGALNGLQSNGTSSQSAYTNTLTGFTTSGFSLGNDGSNTVNLSGDTYASWTFRKQPKFFDVVTYTGNGSTQTISHNLGSVPGCIIVKNLSNTSNWSVYHRGYSTIGGAGDIIQLLNGTQAAFFSASFNNTLPTSTNFQVGLASGTNNTNNNGDQYVAYLFAHNSGGFGLTGTDNVISCGSYTGSNSTATTVTLGYEPQWIMIKRATGSQSAYTGWAIFDNMRGMPVTGNDNTLLANTSDAENPATANGAFVSPTATGFTLNVAGSNLTNTPDTYIYIAIRRGPMAVPTTGTSVFLPTARTGTGSNTTITTGFVNDSVWSSQRAGGYRGVFDRLRGSNNVLFQNYTGAEDSTSYTDTLTSFANNTGVNVGADASWGGINLSGASEATYSFGRAPSFFDEVCYTGDGGSVGYVLHNLTVAPQLWIVKRRSASGTNWAVGSTQILASQSLALNTTNSATDIFSVGFWNSTYPDSTKLYLGGNTAVNSNGQTYVAYLFATCPGVSKVGSYTGNGTTQAIACGFTGGARFVLIKRTDSTGDWYVYDTARGMTTLTDPYLLLDTSGAEVATLGSVTTTTGGFTVNASVLSAINTNAATYIFLAIA